MTNDQIIKMVRAGLGEDVVLSAIKSAAPSAFDLSPDGLITLKTAGVSERIIRVMQGSDGSASAVPPAVSATTKTGVAPTSDPNDPTAPHDPGIYAVIAGKVVKLEPSAFTHSQTGNGFLAGVTYGAKKVKTRAVVHGRSAHLHVTQPTEFYFYFGALDPRLSSIGFAGFSGAATNPNEFVLVKFEAGKNERSIVMSEFGVWAGADYGARSKDQVLFTSEKVGEGIYKVTLPQDTELGEYAFFSAGSARMAMVAGGKIFDFGIDK